MDEPLDAVLNRITACRKKEIRICVQNEYYRGILWLPKAITGMNMGFPGISELSPAYTIHNDRTMAPGTVRAELTFYSREEMLSIVSFLLGALSAECLEEMQPETYEDIAYLPIEELEQKLDHVAAGLSWFTYLRLIVEDMRGTSGSVSPSVRTLCGTPPMILTDPAEMARYVQRGRDEQSGPDCGEPYCSYLAVRSVDYYLHFPWTNAPLGFSVEHPRIDNPVCVADRQKRMGAADGLLMVKRVHDRYSLNYSLPRDTEREILSRMREGRDRQPPKQVYYLFEGSNSPWNHTTLQRAAILYRDTHCPEVRWGIVKDMDDPEEILEFLRKDLLLPLTEGFS